MLLQRLQRDPLFEGVCPCRLCRRLRCGPGWTRIEHGWIEANGELLDPTLPYDDLTYFPGLRWSGQEGIARAFRIPKDKGTDDLPFLY